MSLDIVRSSEDLPKILLISTVSPCVLKSIFSQEKKQRINFSQVTFVMRILNMQFLKSENESPISYLSLPLLHILRLIGSKRPETV